MERVSHADGRQRDVAEHSKPIESNAILVGHGLPVWQARPGLNLFEHDSFLDVPETGDGHGGDGRPFVLLGGQRRRQETGDDRRQDERFTAADDSTPTRGRQLCSFGIAESRT